MALLPTSLFQWILNSYTQPLQTAVDSVEKQKLLEEQKRKELQNQQQIQTQQNDWQESDLMKKFRELAEQWNNQASQMQQSMNQESVSQLPEGSTTEMVWTGEKWSDFWQSASEWMQNIQDIASDKDKNIVTKVAESAWVIGRDVIAWTVWELLSKWLEATWISWVLWSAWKAVYWTDTWKALVDTALEAYKSWEEAWDWFKKENPNAAGLISWIEWIAEWITTLTWAKSVWQALWKWFVKVWEKTWVSWLVDAATDLPASVLWTTTWLWKEWVKEMYKIWKEWIKVKNETFKDISDSIWKDVKLSKENERKIFWKDYSEFESVSNNTPKINFQKKIDEFTNTVKNDFKWIDINLKSKDWKYNFKINNKNSPLSESDWNKLKDLLWMIADYNSKKDWLSLVELDTLKQKINNTIRRESFDETITPVQWLWARFAQEVDNLIKENDTTWIYARMNQKRSDFFNQLSDITDTLSQKDTSATMTKLTKLNQTFRWDSQFRTEAVNWLDELLWSNYASRIANVMSKDWIWKWFTWKISALVAAWWLAAATSLWPMLIIWLAWSPKLVWKFAKTLWYSKNKLDTLVNAVTLQNKSLKKASVWVLWAEVAKESNTEQKKKVYKDKNWNIINIKQ